MTGLAAGERIPISLVTGFLGSGKTTLIAALLKQPAMAGTAVVVNEFGAVGIDDAIFAQAVDAENLRLLANGCLCCTAGDDLTATVWSLAQRADRPRRIVIETTGLADPAPALRRLMGDPRLAQSTRLDTLVATIDAVSGLKNLDNQPVAARQCAIADRQVITKSDIAAADDVDTLKARLRMLNPAATILQIDHGAIDAETLLSASLYNPKAGVADVDRWLNVEALRGHGPWHDHDHDGGHHPVATWLLEEDRPVALELFLEKVGRIIGRYGDLLLRVKGVIQASDDPRPIVIHGVQRMFHPPVRLHGWRSQPGTRIVVIGEKAAAPAIAEIASALSSSAESVLPAGSVGLEICGDAGPRELTA